MNQSIEHVEASQGAEFAAQHIAQAVVWSSMEWWQHSDGVNLVRPVPMKGEPNGLTEMKAVGFLWK